MDRVAQNTAPDVDFTFLLGSTPVDPSPATATVTITRADGTVVAAIQPTTRLDVGKFRYTLDETNTVNVDILRFEWTATFSGNPQTRPSYVEIVGGFYADLAAIRAYDPQLAAAGITTAEMEEARAWAEDTIERAAGVAFVPRYGRELLDGSGMQRMFLWKSHHVRRLLTVKVAGVAQTLADFVAYPYGHVVWKTGTFTGATATTPLNVEITYEHGYDAPPGDIREVFLGLVRRKLLGEQSGPQEQEALLPEAVSSGPTGVGPWDRTLRSYRVPVII